jgi:hypothetical protein
VNKENRQAGLLRTKKAAPEGSPFFISMALLYAFSFGCQILPFASFPLVKPAIMVK